MSNKITLLVLIIADKQQKNSFDAFYNFIFSISCHISFASLMNCEEMNFLTHIVQSKKEEISFMCESFIDVEKIDIFFVLFSLKGEQKIKINEMENENAMHTNCIIVGH